MYQTLALVVGTTMWLLSLLTVYLNVDLTAASLQELIGVSSGTGYMYGGLLGACLAGGQLAYLTRSIMGLSTIETKVLIGMASAVSIVTNLWALTATRAAGSIAWLFSVAYGVSIVTMLILGLVVASQLILLSKWQADWRRTWFANWKRRLLPAEPERPDNHSTLAKAQPDISYPEATEPASFNSTFEDELADAVALPEPAATEPAGPSVRQQADRDPVPVRDSGEELVLESDHPVEQQEVSLDNPINIDLGEDGLVRVYLRSYSRNQMKTIRSGLARQVTRYVDWRKPVSLGDQNWLLEGVLRRRANAHTVEALLRRYARSRNASYSENT